MSKSVAPTDLWPKIEPLEKADKSIYDTLIGDVTKFRNTCVVATIAFLGREPKVEVYDWKVEFEPLDAPVMTSTGKVDVEQLHMKRLVVITNYDKFYLTNFDKPLFESDELNESLLMEPKEFVKRVNEVLTWEEKADTKRLTMAEEVASLLHYNFDADKEGAKEFAKEEIKRRTSHIGAGSLQDRRDQVIRNTIQAYTER